MDIEGRKVIIHAADLDGYLTVIYFIITKEKFGVYNIFAKHFEYYCIHKSLIIL